MDLDDLLDKQMFHRANFETKVSTLYDQKRILNT